MDNKVLIKRIEVLESALEKQTALLDELTTDRFITDTKIEVTLEQLLKGKDVTPLPFLKAFIELRDKPYDTQGKYKPSDNFLLAFKSEASRWEELIVDPLVIDLSESH